MLKLFWKLQQVVMHQLAEWRFDLSLFYNLYYGVKYVESPCVPCLHDSSLALNAVTLSDNLKTVVIFLWSERLSSLSKLKYYTGKQV